MPGLRPRHSLLLRAALLAMAGGLTLDGSAIAAEWTIAGTVSERLETETNRQLDGDPDAIYGSTTRASLELTRETERSQLNLSSGVSAALFGGPGDTGGLDRIDPDFAVSYEFSGPRLNVDTALDFDLKPVSFAQTEETGVTTGDATQLTVKLAGNFGYAVDAANQLLFGADVKVVRFTEGATSLTETTTYGFTTGWEHSVNQRLKLDLGLGTNMFEADNASASRSLTFDVTAGAGYRFNARLDVSADIGLDLTRTANTINGARQVETSLGVVADAALNWQAAPDTSLSLAFSQGLEPSSLGELQTTTRLSFDGTYQFNTMANADLKLVYLRQSSSGGFETNGTRRDLITLTPGLSYTLSPDWSARLGYTLRHEIQDTTGTGGPGTSHLVFLELTRSLKILP